MKFSGHILRMIGWPNGISPLLSQWKLRTIVEWNWKSPPGNRHRGGKYTRQIYVPNTNRQSAILRQSHKTCRQFSKTWIEKSKKNSEREYEETLRQEEIKNTYTHNRIYVLTLHRKVQFPLELQPLDWILMTHVTHTRDGDDSFYIQFSFFSLHVVFSFLLY